EAANLQPGDEVLEYESEMLLVRDGIQTDEGSEGVSTANGAGLLHQGLLGGIQGEAVVGDDAPDKPKVLLGAYDSQQPNEACRKPRKNESHGAGDGVRAESTGREWQTADCAGSNSKHDVLRSGLRAAADNPHGLGRGTAEVLQTGHGTLGASHILGGGRPEPQYSRETGVGCSKRRVSNWRRVDSVEVFKSDNPGRTDGSLGDGYVYNFEVE